MTSRWGGEAELSLPIEIESLDEVCHDLVSFSLQTLPVINETHDLTTTFPLSYLIIHIPYHPFILSKARRHNIQDIYQATQDIALD